MENRKCPLCEHDSEALLDLCEPEIKTGRNVICTHCGMIYHNPVMTNDEMIAYYQKNFSGEYHESREMQQEIAENHYQCLTAHLGPMSVPEPILEIGCAYGDFIRCLTDNGLDASGLEPSEMLSETGRNTRNVKITTGHYESKPLQTKRFGMIALFHVLEHFRHPLNILQKIRSELKEDGILYLEVPTMAQSQLALVFKAIHPSVFVLPTLETMLNISGFRIMHLEQKGSNLLALARKGAIETSSYPGASDIAEDVNRYITRRKKMIGHIRRRLEELKPLKQVAVYGAGHNTIDLHSVFPLDTLALSGIYDADPAKQGQTLLGQRIQPPEALKQFKGDAVLISSFRYQEEILEQLSFLKQQGVALVPLYEK